jgi:hypothetical protein
LTPKLGVWASPQENIQTPEDLVAMLKDVHLPGHETEVYIPTYYDDWPQQVLSQRAIGDAFAVDGPEDAAAMRATIESLGLKCGGWSVPRGTGDIYAEGYKQGTCAAMFDHFILNFEDGWAGFWTQDGVNAITLFLSGFWDALKAAGRGPDNFLLGITFVTNAAMLGAVSVAEASEWLGGTHYVALEAYVPDDPGLDPANSLRRMQSVLNASGYPNMRMVCILEQGDVVSLAQEFSHPELGVQIWTAAVAASASWPPVEDPVQPLPDVDWAWQAKKDQVVATTGELVAVRQMFDTEASRKAGPRRAEIKRLADQEMQPRLDKILA